MPAPRRMTRHVEGLEAHGRTVRDCFELVSRSVVDGIVTMHERADIDRCARESVESTVKQIAEATVIDARQRWIARFENTLEFTPWVTHKGREVVEDEAALIEAGLIIPFPVSGDDEPSGPAAMAA